MKRCHWTLRVLKSSKVNGGFSLIRFQGLKITLYDTRLYVWDPGSVLWVIVPFSWKICVCSWMVLSCSFLPKKKKNKIIVRLTSWFCYLLYPFPSKLTVVLLKQFSQELSEPWWISRGLNSLDKSHSYRHFWDSIFCIFGSCWDGWETVSFLGALWFIWEVLRGTLNPFNRFLGLLFILTFWSL